MTLCFMVGRYYSSYRGKVRGNPGCSKSVGIIFPTAFLSLCVSVPHFGDFHDTSEVFFVVIFVTVLFNQ